MSPNGPRLAECVREGNVTSWRQGGESCTLAKNIVSGAFSRPASAAIATKTSSLPLFVVHRSPN
jgi:hypothetical protein